MFLTRSLRHTGRDHSSGRHGNQPGFLLEFPWNFYGFRDILTPNVLRENGTFLVPVDALNESGSVNTLLFEDTSFSVARLPAVALNLLGGEQGQAMEITQQEVEKVAKLARLELTDIEKAAFAKQLSQILTHVETLKQYDTTGVEPTATVRGQVNVFRSDIVRTSLSVERAVANAPESADGFFVVPKIIEDRQPL